MKLISNKITVLLPVLAAILSLTAGCKKGTFDINSVSPNSPSSVSPTFSLSSALTATSSLMYGGNEDFLNLWMGYWTVSGDFTASPTLIDYQLTTDFGTGNWESAYINLSNYQLIQTESATDSSLQYFAGIAQIMKAFVFQRIVDLYNNIPYSTALSSSNYTPAYDKGSDVYNSLINQVDSGITAIKAGLAISGISQNPKGSDVMFGGDMNEWIKFGNTLKLKLLLRLTETSGGAAKITSGLNGLTTADFLGAGEDASVNPGYSKASDAKENPFYLDIAFTSNNNPGTNYKFYRANSYAVNFYYDNNDPRVNYIYEVKDDSLVHGRVFGAAAGPDDHNSSISAVNGSGIAKGPDQDAIIIGAYESLFLQAEAIERGYLSGNVTDVYNSAVAESFRALSVPDYASAAATYTSQNSGTANYAKSSNKLQTIIVQKWAACNATDPLESYSDWRRLKYPSNLPVSVDPGNTAPHIPYRLLYPTSEYSYNNANVSAESEINYLTSKIFWMP